MYTKTEHAIMRGVAGVIYRYLVYVSRRVMIHTYLDRRVRYSWKVHVVREVYQYILKTRRQDGGLSVCSG